MPDGFWHATFGADGRVVDLVIDAPEMSASALGEVEAALASLRFAHEFAMLAMMTEHDLLSAARALVSTSRDLDDLADTLAEEGLEEESAAVQRLARSCRRGAFLLLVLRPRASRSLWHPSADPPPAPPGRRVRGNPRRTCAPPNAHHPRNLRRTVSAPVYTVH